MSTRWSRGRGRLGLLDPLLGTWVAEGESELGHYRVQRGLERVLQRSHVRMNVHWDLGDRSYDEWAIFGADRDGTVGFWSFTSDGKQSRGHLVAADDLPSGGFSFEADMPAGRARMLFLPRDHGPGFRFAVESRSAEGWRRFVEHEYLPAEGGTAQPALSGP